MTAPYVVVSDLHFHGWSAFSKTTSKGENTRHLQILDSLREAAAKLKSVGGKVMFIAGDIFHRRGEIAPNILNPTMDLFRELIGQGIEIYAIPGNHDLTSNDSQRVGNSVTALESVGVVVAHEPMMVEVAESHMVLMFPWFSTVKELLHSMEMFRSRVLTSFNGDLDQIEAIIHAPIDGVLPHLPAHGLDAKAIGRIGFDRVFCGHYHHHRDMGDHVYSVGALTHQTWGDIGSKAGFLIVDADVTHYETAHPKFVELTGEEDETEAKALCSGNYVRVKGEITTESEIQEIREGVESFGALGVQVIPVKKTVVTRAGAAPTATGVSLEGSIKTFLDKKTVRPEAHALALDILNEARGL